MNSKVRIADSLLRAHGASAILVAAASILPLAAVAQVTGTLPPLDVNASSPGLITVPSGALLDFKVYNSGTQPVGGLWAGLSLQDGSYVGRIVPTVPAGAIVETPFTIECPNSQLKCGVVPSFWNPTSLKGLRFDLGLTTFLSNPTSASSVTNFTASEWRFSRATYNGLSLSFKPDFRLSFDRTTRTTGPLLQVGSSFTANNYTYGIFNPFDTPRSYLVSSFNDAGTVASSQTLSVPGGQAVYGTIPASNDSRLSFTGIGAIESYTPDGHRIGNDQFCDDRDTFYDSPGEAFLAYVAFGVWSSYCAVMP